MARSSIYGEATVILASWASRHHWAPAPRQKMATWRRHVMTRKDRQNSPVFRGIRPLTWHLSCRGPMFPITGPGIEPCVPRE